MAKPSQMLSCNAEDFTGAIAMANKRVPAAMPVIQTIGAPDGVETVDAEAVVVNQHAKCPHRGIPLRAVMLGPVGNGEPLPLGETSIDGRRQEFNAPW
jgi:hypothetical protein